MSDVTQHLDDSQSLQFFLYGAQDPFCTFHLCLPAADSTWLFSVHAYRMIIENSVA
jgi:hypothetical protein